MLRVRHSLRLTLEFLNYARVNGAWWLMLILPVLALGLVAVGATQVAVPYTVYTLF